MKKLVFLLLLGCCACFAGRERAVVWSDLPETRKLSDVGHTAFVPALECAVDPGQNVIYTPSFLYAWQEVKKTVGSEARKNDTWLSAVMRSDAYEGALKHGDYETEVETDGDKISVHAFFRTRLPFRVHMHTEDNFLFAKKRVRAFGARYYSYSLSKFVSLPYYENDDHFIVRLEPTNPDYEFLLVKGVSDTGDLAEALKKTYALMNKDANRLTTEDVLLVPMIRFNIETNYPQLETSVFQTVNGIYKIEKAYQRTGFALTEKGAVVESEAEVEVAETAAALDKPIPKKLLFNKPFYIIIKRKDTQNPSFMMKVEDATFMEEVK